MYDETLRLAKLAGSEAVPQVAIADDDVEGTQSPLGMKGNQCRANKRFTMLSKTALFRQAYSSNSKEASSVSGQQEDGMTTDSLIVVESSLLSCPILSPMIARYFCCIWWDVSPPKIVPQLCESLLSTKTSSSIMTKTDILSISYKQPSVGYREMQQQTPNMFRTVFFITPKNYFPRLSLLADLGIFESYREGAEMYILKDAAFTVARKRTFGTMKRRSSSVSAGALPHGFGAQHGVGAHRQSCVQEYDSVLSGMSSEIMDQAQQLLSRLLLVSMPSDGVMLLQPILCHDIERMTYMACSIVHAILTYGYRRLFISRSDLLAVEVILKDAQVVLNSLDPVAGMLEATAREIIVAIRDLSHSMTVLKAEIEIAQNVQTSAPKSTILNESYLMSLEDIRVYQHNIEQIQMQFDYEVQENRKTIKSGSARDWHECSKCFEGTPSKLHLCVMRSLLIISNSVPSSSNADWRNSIDDITVTRLAISMLKSMGLVNRLILLNPATINQLQLKQCREIYALISTLEGNLGGAEESGVNFSSSVESLSQSQSTFSGDESTVEMNPLNPLGMTKLIAFLKNIDLLAEKHERCVGLQTTLLSKQQESEQILLAIKMEQNSSIVALKMKLNALETELHHLDSELFCVREKTKRVSALQIDKRKFQTAIAQSASYIQAEKQQLDVILEKVVPDACIAAALLVRAGWLPEQYRQECLDSLRAEAQLLSHHPSDSPFVLGCMVDRIQMRNWVDSSKGYISNDIPSLNSMNLVSLCPAYTFVVDPEGICSLALSNAWEAIYRCHVVDAKAFALSDILSQIQKSDSKDEIMVLIVTDVQSGVSEDLIAFLTAELDILPDTRGTKADLSGTGVLLESTANLFASIDPLYKSLNRKNKLIPLGQLKVVLISTEPPTLDSSGVGRPLPSQCFKNMVVVHWASSSSVSSFCSDAKPVVNTTNRYHCASRMLESSMFRMLCEQISPEYFTRLSILNSRISENTNQLYNTETSILSSIAQWLASQVDKEPKFDVYASKYVTIPKIQLSFLEDDTCSQLLLASLSKRIVMTSVLQNAKLLEREQFAYQKVVSEVCGMACDFFRMCTTLIPTNLLPPYALNTLTICNVFMKAFIQDADTVFYLQRVPSSLRKIHRFTTAIVEFQTKFRKYKHISVSMFDDNTYSKSKASKKEKNSKKMSSRQANAKPTHARKKSVSEIISDAKVEDMVAVKLGVRKELMNQLAMCCQPLHSLMLKGAFAYIQRLIHPRYEYLVKLSLLLSSWSQATVLPNDELRAFASLLSKSTGNSPIYFGLEVNTDSAGGHNSTAQRAMGLVQGLHVSPRNQMSLRERSNSIQILGIAPRPESFWNYNTPKVQQQQSIEIPSWMIRGHGPLEGLWLQRSSLRWKIGYISAKRGGDIPNRWDPLICDVPNSNIVVKNALFKPVPRQQDIYILEWLRIIGARIATEIKGPSTTAQVTNMIQSVNYRMSRAFSSHHSHATVAKKSQRVSSSASKKVDSKQRLTSASTSSALRQSVAMRSIRKQSVMATGTSALSLLNSVQQPSNNKQNIGSESKKNSHIGADEAKVFASILDSKEAYYDFKLLERHSSLKPIYGGITVCASMNLSEFVKWKAFVESLAKINVFDLGQAELVQVAASTIPPQLVSDEDIAEELGVWASGKELTVLQTLLALLTISPAAVEFVSNVLFSLTLAYLKTGAVIVKHSDEYSDDESSGEDSDGESDEFEEAQSSGEMFPSIAEEGEEESEEGSESASSSQGDAAGDSDEHDKYDEEDEDEEDQFNDFGDGMNDSVSMLHDDRGRFQDDVFHMNFWTKLKRVAGGMESGKHIRLSRQRKSQTALSFRCYENWESVIMDVLGNDVSSEQTDIASDIKSCFKNNGSLFLASNNQPYQHMTNLSNYSREIVKSSISDLKAKFNIVNCDFDAIMVGSTFRSVGGLLTSTEMNDLARKKVRRIAEAIDYSSRNVVVHKFDTLKYITCIEMVNLRSSMSSSIFRDCLVNPPHELATMSRMHLSIYEISAMASFAPKTDIPSHSASMMIVESSQSASNFVVSAEWSSRRRSEWGLAPPLSISFHKMKWLPTVLLPELIGYKYFAGGKWQHKGMSPLIPYSTAISCINENLRINLVWVENSFKSIERSKAGSDVLEVIKSVTAEDLRASAALLLLWNINVYLKCVIRHLNSLPAMWSSSLESIQMWQFTRLLVKVHAVLRSIPDYQKVIYSEVSASATLEEMCVVLLQNKSFGRSMCILCESFCKIFYDHEDVSSRHIQPHRPDSATGPGSRSRMSQLIRSSSSDASSSDKSFLSSYTEKTKLINSQLGISPTSVSVSKQKFSISLSAIEGKLKPSQLRKLRRDKLRAEKNDRSNLHYVSFDSLSSMGLFTLGSNPKLYVSKEFRNRLLAVLSVFMSNMICKKIVRRDVPLTSRPSSKERSRRNVDLRNGAGGKVGSGDGDFGERWPAIASSLSDISVGCLASNEVTSHLLDWVLHK